MKRTRIVIFGLAATAAFVVRAGAQQPYPLHEMNFDMWCQEERHLPAARCDKRTPDDDAAFQAYRAKIEKYEIPYQQERNYEQNLNRVILHNDPVDNPKTPSAPQVDTPSTQAGAPSTQH